jgi:hypothetical protein
MTCVGCGSTALIQGHLQSGGDGSTINFQLDDAGLMRRLFTSGRQVHAYGCIKCGHLQFAAAFTDKDRERYQEFEGMQPSVLERINKDTE